MDVADRVILITGASSGVGAALAEQLAGMGAGSSLTTADPQKPLTRSSRASPQPGAGTGSAGRRIRRGRLQATGGRDD
ncbi:MAG: hypothetical protein CM15mP74_05340 [Halieaceae bacterium]|nr:MAG: hypothetical protein CM15mP74_05340 [Halieaceae bacterium]